MLPASSAVAIPSPELIIGSVSSLSQIFGIAFASLTGAAAYTAKRFGVTTSGTTSKIAKYTMLITGALCIILTFLNIWQYDLYASREASRLQDTLVRPAQFNGTSIKDDNLIETSFSNQRNSHLAISTEQAADLFERPNDAMFIDVRESGEHAMGTLPHSTHIRFPDISLQNISSLGRPVVLFCHNGNRSSETCEKLAALGIDCKFIAGGIEKWLVEGRQISDLEISDLSELRALPSFKNDNVLLNTHQFSDHLSTGEVQVLDARYPGDFDGGHLPNAVNIPLRALPTFELSQRISALPKIPAVVACYDRRSCFIGQVLAYELTKAGIPFVGRYTTPWEFFIPQTPKPHVVEWLEGREAGLWDRGVNLLASVLIRVSQSSHLVFAIFGLAVVSRIIVLPIALKSERDQFVTKSNRAEFAAIKRKLKSDPTRKARAIRNFYEHHNITPVRNLLGLLFLPVMMLGLSAVEQAANVYPETLFSRDLGLPDPTFLMPAIFALLASTYLQWVAAKSRIQGLLWWLLATPIVFAVATQLTMAGAVYLCASLALLLLQRSFVTGQFNSLFTWTKLKLFEKSARRAKYGIHSLSDAKSLANSGNKSLRLSMMKASGLPVPNGVVLSPDFISVYSTSSQLNKEWLANLVWKSMSEVHCAVRSSSSVEDGSNSSFAGVFESVLDVNHSSLPTAIDTVIASFSGDRVGAYSDAPEHNVGANILVQQMISADYSGVLFTQNPATVGFQLIEYVQGCGENLVSGLVTPTSAAFGRFSLLPADDSEHALDLKPLLLLGQKIESIFGRPQDIEWAYKGGNFYILQSRDITAVKGASEADRLKQSELARLLKQHSDSPSDTTILEQDELSEVLPEPTTISFDLMSRLWSPGGSLDLASRSLGVPYKLPEGLPGHMKLVLGRTFINSTLKQTMTVSLSKMGAKRLSKIAPDIRADFQSNSISQIRRKICRLSATNYTQLPHKELLEIICEIVLEFTDNAYVEAEKINFLAGFLMSEAQAATKNNSGERHRLLTSRLPNAPSQLMAKYGGGGDGISKVALLKVMGHRAGIDYELSAPRYREDPTSLFAFAQHTDKMPVIPGLRNDTDPVSLAITFQDLKEQAKHEALRFVDQLRRALIALSETTKLGDLVFHMTFDEIQSLSENPSKDLIDELESRKRKREFLLSIPPPSSRITLNDLEVYSAPSLLVQKTSGALGGTCVSGTGSVSGAVFRVASGIAPEQAFAGFTDGDIIVCKMIDPNWLPLCAKIWRRVVRSRRMVEPHGDCSSRKRFDDAREMLWNSGFRTWPVYFGL